MKNLNFNILEDKINSLSSEDREFLLSIGLDGILRKFLSSDEIKKLNKLYKLGLVEKGIFPDRFQNVMYYIDSSVWHRL